MGKINLKDIARLSEVSITTVSRVLNDPEHVNAATRERVYRVMRELDYQPGFPSLKKDKPRILAIVVPVLNSDFTTDFIIALEKELHPYNIYPLLVHTQDEADLSAFLSHDNSWVTLADMAVIITMDIDERAQSYLKERGLPFGAVHSRCSHTFSVMNNNYLGGYDAAGHLWNKGYRKIGVVRWSGETVSFQDDRLTGFYRKLDELGIPRQDIPEEESSLTIAGGAGATRRILKDHDCEALFYTSDTMAIGGIEYCHKNKIAIPDDLALMGFDDIRMAASLNLTTMKQFIPAKARAIADYLVNRSRMNPPPEYPEEMTITPVLVERQTT
ncbi:MULTISPECIES: LacI family DNA-binding transcriptional regulator [unclassified Oceanispirochaeta]|uniref:LacI family DNA-binding transcriptional regulator n=1 Tax=unclassified Oceanispirochaeta TaxID=2635722 RepID=UPI000E08D261|nr:MULTISPECIES: LacI family DNA-binding transcriptional regulator [unclassified Oceanispirochaeta]MBF9014169.1 LacI family DNA-binding transcriptional regulator [Oceanispirochaeta sp. M2]NPD70659.1 LacI family transcriptional regulator [Oceanispirochaeta sp. M1]RDG34421.1 LacI family transcriptional regulator [Oceanispirochaeta sp. M1]